MIRAARIIDLGLDVEVARFGPEVVDDTMVACAAAEALTAPFTLVRIDSVVEPIAFTEMARAYCSGMPANN